MATDPFAKWTKSYDTPAPSSEKSADPFAKWSSQKTKASVVSESKKGLIGQAYDALKVPEQKSKEGFDLMSKAAGELYPPVPVTGNTAIDVINNAPNIMATSTMDTLGKVAPGFVSPLSLGMIGASGALKAPQALAKAAPYAESIPGVGPALARALQAPLGAAKSVGRGLEGLSGLEYKTPGILGRVVNEPGLPYGPGKDAARELYKAALNPAAVASAAADALSPDKVVRVAQRAYATGTLNPETALEARKALYQTGAGDAAIAKWGDIFDKVAKTKTAAADAAYEAGSKSEALRQLFPINKGGGTSIFKIVGGGIAGMKGKPDSTIIDAIRAVAFGSPLAQGQAAAAVGALKGAGTSAAATGPALDSAKEAASAIKRRLSTR